jgi:hypothetical protein
LYTGALEQDIQCDHEGEPLPALCRYVIAPNGNIAGLRMYYGPPSAPAAGTNAGYDEHAGDVNATVGELALWDKYIVGVSGGEWGRVRENHSLCSGSVRGGLGTQLELEQHLRKVPVPLQQRKPKALLHTGVTVYRAQFPGCVSTCQPGCCTVHGQGCMMQ